MINVYCTPPPPPPNDDRVELSSFTTTKSLLLFSLAVHVSIYTRLLSSSFV
jgi:hypothetical protein